MYASSSASSRTTTVAIWVQPHRQVGGGPRRMVRCPPAAPSDLLSYAGYRFPVEIISHAAWYFRFSLTLRDVEEILAERGVHGQL